MSTGRMDSKCLRPLLWAVLSLLLLGRHNLVSGGGPVTRNGITDNNATSNNMSIAGGDQRMTSSSRSPVPLSSSSSSLMSRWTDEGDVVDEMMGRLSSVQFVANRSSSNRSDIHRLSRHVDEGEQQQQHQQQYKVDSSKASGVGKKRKRRSGVEGARNRRPDLNKRGTWWPLAKG